MVGSGGIQRVALAAAALGLLTATIGTFLPWVESGQVGRNSYASAGLLQRLLDLNGMAGTALDAWPFLGLAAAVAIALIIAGWRRTAAVLAVIVGAGTAVVGVLALRTDATGPVRHASLGPIVTTFGGSAAVIAATLLLISHQYHSTQSRRDS